ncbi:MAG TPA: hypothetical protein VFB14_11445 [Bryobacteraceae bacterium]|nr:hypothetical protein [Bryobacteraceae bacterium]
MEPLNEYTSRRGRWRAEQEFLQQRFIRIGNWRLVVGIAAAVLAWFIFAQHAIPLWTLLVTVVIFIGLAVWHQRVIRRRTMATRAIQYYERGLARLADRWQGTGSSGDGFRSEAHVYADDLDVFGKGSLFELISTARTTMGEQTLSSWLLHAAGCEDVRARHASVRELSGRLDLREDLALLGEDIRAELQPDMLVRWASGPPVNFHPVLRPLLLALAIAGIGSIVAFFAQVLPISVVIGILVCDFFLKFLLRQRAAQVTEGVHAPAEELNVLSLLLRRLEKETFESQRLSQLRSALEIRGLPASKRIAKLERWIEWLDSGDHVLIRILRPILLWEEQIAMGLEAWRRANGPHIGRWLSAVGEFEALSSLAALLFERPQWVFPELHSGGGSQFEAEALQHPLMPAGKCVPNDVRLDAKRQLLIVSGSNMSGKSTLLRSVGLATVLAWAGAPVAAARLRISPLQPGASIRVTDSLQDNRSRFFAEITRIREIVDLTRNGRPVLFLLDELLSGTNSHDRRIGAAGIVRGLVHSGAIGLITTHDLALADIEQDLGPAAANVHFEDQMVDGQMVFDYRLRPGVVAHSNALELMRAVGLEV